VTVVAPVYVPGFLWNAIIRVYYFLEYTALLKSLKHIEHPLIFEETINGENDTFQLDFFYLLSVRSRVDRFPKEPFQDRKNRFGHVPTTVGFFIE